LLNISRFACLLAMVPVIANAASLPPCESSPKLVGTCFTVHGRLEDDYQGVFTSRIWVIGTHRLLGIMDVWQMKENRDSPLLPGNIQDLMDEGPKRPYFVFGDFRVCPFSRERRGWMRFVCVQNGKNLFRTPIH
jgi:hypothetical protein